MCVTFVLSALGYDDSKGEFHWETSSCDLAKSVGFLTPEDLADINGGAFDSHDVVNICSKASRVDVQGGNRTLVTTLWEPVVVTQCPTTSTIPT